MIFTIFYLILFAEVTLLLIVLNLAFNRRISIWPPRGAKSKSIYVLMVIFYLIIAGSIWICIQEWGSPLIEFQWIRYIGTAISGLGLILYMWCRMHMSKRVEFGGTDHLITNGPYRYTRNPIYIADILIFLGFALLSNSLLVTILMCLLVITLLLLPLIEEPWLLEQYGEKYKNYMSKVPRYL